MYTQLGASSHESPGKTADALKIATATANTQINEYSVRIPNHTGMGTTATIAALAGRVLVVSQVGDSRAYLLRAGHATQLTRDQSLMQRLVDAGELTQEEAEKSDRRNIILQALGPESEIVTDISRCELQEGDLVLLCTDGLSGLVKESDMVRLAADAGGVRELAVSLVQLANDRGGPDNITVVLARISDAQHAGDAPEPAGQLSRGAVYTILAATLLGLLVILMRGGN
jgi:protein phosphatase